MIDIQAKLREMQGLLDATDNARNEKRAIGRANQDAASSKAKKARAERETLENKSQRRGPGVIPLTDQELRSSILSRKGKFENAHFIAIDGEGVSEGKIESFRQTGVGEKITYKGQEHFMMLLAASTGDEITATSGRLSMIDCIEFLLRVQSENKKAILCCYGGSYDVNQIMLYDLTRDGLRYLSKGAKIQFVKNDCCYRIQYRARKSLQVWKWNTAEIPYHENNKGNWVPTKADASFVLWDTIGFFQQTFEQTMKVWLGTDHPDLLFIADMKAKRSEFTREMLGEMIVYNRAECRALVAVMNKLRLSIEGLGLALKRWDGAGAVASAINAKHNIKACKGDAPEPVFHAARVAFSGGHIEAVKLGTFNSVVHHYDVNSAYPSIIMDLPNLCDAHWQHETGFDPTPGFTLVKVRYEFAGNMPFYPLFFRTPDGAIIYPQSGCGWYWYNEFDVARDFYTQFGGSKFEVLEAWHCKPQHNNKPFAFVHEYYAARLEMVRKTRANELTDADRWMEGGEKVIKLGLNSLYGKTAQQVGGSQDEAPPYFQIEWAGFVTSGCRAQLMRAAMQEPKSIVSFATDGLFSLKPLTLDCPDQKRLGAWEYKLHTGMVIAMPGVYWLYDDGETPAKCHPQKKNAYSRGFDKAYVETPDLIMEAWKAGQSKVPLPIRRLVTMGSACASIDEHDPLQRSHMWRARGRFLSGVRSLDITGASRKRDGVNVGAELWKRPAATLPRLNYEYDDWWLDHYRANTAPDDERACSRAYDIRWLMKKEPGEPDDFDVNDLGELLQNEIIDAGGDFI